MNATVSPGTPVGQQEPGAAASIADAVSALGGARCILEAWDDGARIEVHLGDGEPIVIGADDPGVAEAVAGIEAASAVLLGTWSARGVRFDDLLWWEGRSLASRPLAERLAALAEVVPVSRVHQHTTVDDPSWGEAFAGHARSQGYPGVIVRDAAGGWPTRQFRVVF